MTVIGVTIDYTFLGKIENELRSSPYQLKEIHYLEAVEIDVYVETENIESYKDWMTELTNGQGILTEKEAVYLESLI